MIPGLPPDGSGSVVFARRVCVVVDGLIAGNASSHRSFAWPGSSGRPGSLWEPALPAMRPSASTSILLAGLFLPASSLAMPAPTGSCAWPESSGRPGSLWEPALPAMRPSASTSTLLAGLFLPASSLASQLPQVLVPGLNPAADRGPCGSRLAGDEAISFDINLAGRVVPAGLIAGKPAPTGSCAWPESSGRPGSLWEPACRR